MGHGAADLRQRLERQPDLPGARHLPAELRRGLRFRPHLQLARRCQSGARAGRSRSTSRWTSTTTSRRRQTATSPTTRVTYGDGTRARVRLQRSAQPVDFHRRRRRVRNAAGAAQQASRRDPTYTVTRADRSVYLFDKDFKLLSVTDANGVTTTFDYKGNNVVTIHDDTGHVLTLTLRQGDKLLSVSDETNGRARAVRLYRRPADPVTDRYGHVTKYHYNSDKLLDSITLPDTQKVNGVNADVRDADGVVHLRRRSSGTTTRTTRPISTGRRVGADVRSPTRTAA